jgi:hypothetical protein
MPTSDKNSGLPANSENPFLRSALFYALKLQWRVFPIKPRAKQPPLTKHGCLDASSDEKQIRAWWAKWPQANVGVATGEKIWVLDIDPRHGGEDSRARLVTEHGAFAETLRQITGGGGSQWLYEMPDQVVIKNSTAVCGWKGIDVRGSGGYIVAPPSIHPSGQAYQWESIEQAICPADAWLIEAVCEKNGNRSHRQTRRGPFELPDKIPHGKQHDYLVSEAGKLRHMGLEYPEILAALWATNQTRCEKPGPREAIEQYARSVCNYAPGPRLPEEKDEPKANGSTGTGPASWPEPIPFARPEPDEFLPGWLPSWLGDMAEATAAATETPLALPSLLSLAVVSACVAGKAVVSPEDGYDEPLNIYTCPAMESGNRKTAVLKCVLNPLFEWEAEQMKRTAPERQRLQSLRKSTEARVKALRKQATKAKDPASIEAEIEKLEANLPTVPPVLRFLADDITPEALAHRMSEQNERMAVISDEGGIFETLAGRYSKGVPNLDLWLKGHSASPCRVDRVDPSRPPIILNHPHLTVGISPQPDVIEALRDKPGFRGRGLLARFLYALPKSPLGYRALEPRPIPANIAADYCTGIRQLLDVPLGADIRLRLSPKAYREWKDFQKALELELRDGGKLDGLRDWGAKLPGACLRLAGISHAVECGLGFVDAPPISHDTIQWALDLGACLISHAQCVFNLMERDPTVEHGETLLAWIVRENQPTFTVRDCFRAHQRRFKRVDALRPVLILLEDHNFIRRVQGESTGGRKSSDICEVNPKVLKMEGNRP